MQLPRSFGMRCRAGRSPWLEAHFGVHWRGFEGAMAPLDDAFERIGNSGDGSHAVARKHV